MRALVTGAAGFIGSHLCEYLVAKGYSVDGLDDLSTGRLENLEGLVTSCMFTVTTGSVLSRGLVEDMVSGADVVYHMAGAVGTFTVRDDCLRSLQVNVDGTRHVVEAAYAYGIPLLFASSSEVYGNSKGLLHENSPLLLGSSQRPRWSYALSKAMDESLIAAYVDAGLVAVSARLFNVAGPRQRADFGMVIPRFVRQALAGDPLTVFGTGERTRSFCHVADVVPALARLPLTRKSGIVNIGAVQPVCIKYLARRVIELCDSHSIIISEPLTQVMGSNWDDMDRGVPDTSLAHSMVEFEAVHSLDDIIRSVINEERRA